MHRFEIVLSDAAETCLLVGVNDFNVSTGRSLTLEDWIVLSLTQKAIEREIVAESELIKREADAEVPRRIDARRREMIEALGECSAVRVPPDGPA